MDEADRKLSKQEAGPVTEGSDVLDPEFCSAHPAEPEEEELHGRSEQRFHSSAAR